MRVDGYWARFADGGTRPAIKAELETSPNAWTEVWFLIDTGADRTVFQADFQPLLRHLPTPTADVPVLAGVGGVSPATFVVTKIGLIRDDGERVTIEGIYGVFTDPNSSDVSILGRDVLDLFAVIVDRPTGTIAILAPPHHYQIVR